MDRKEFSKPGSDKVQLLIHELETRQIKLEGQNEELGRIQKELEASRDKYSELYNFAPVGYFVLDQNGVILEANCTGSSLFGMERNLLIGRSLENFATEQDHGASSGSRGIVRRFSGMKF